MRSAASLAVLAVCLAVVSATTLSQRLPPGEARGDVHTRTAGPGETARRLSVFTRHSGASPLHTEGGMLSSGTLGEKWTMTTPFSSGDQLYPPSHITGDASTSTDRQARLFIPRRMFTKTCVMVTTQPDHVSGHNLTHIVETLNSNKAMLADGQASILEAISNISTGTGTGTGTCNLSELEDGQEQILTGITNLGTDLDQLDEILPALATAKTMILDGQGDINNNIDDLDADLSTAKTMIIGGQAGINTNIETLSNSLDTAKTMIIDGQSEITNNIATLSSDLSTAKSMILDAIADIDNDISAVSTSINNAKTMILAGQSTINTNIAGISTQIATTETTILAELTTINNRLDDLETGQQEICDKIEALDVKLDTIINKLMEGGGGGGDTCPDGATLNNGQCFTFTANRDNFAGATAACAAAGGTLATMTADNEAFLYGLADMASNDKAWIGLTRESGSWAWQDGSTYGGFTDWPGAEPSASSMQCGEAQASSSTEGEWNDQSCTSNRNYICQTAAT